MRAINRRPGYRSVYDETTKWATEASEFIHNASHAVMAVEVKRSEAAGVSPSLLPGAIIASETGTALLARLQHRQG